MTRTRPGYVVVLLLCAAAGARVYGQGDPSRSNPLDALSVEERLSCQRAIESVYWRHRLWPESNWPRTKPPVEQMMPESLVRAKVEDYLRKSNALEMVAQRPITSRQLQAEMDRMARQSHQPERLVELCEALGNNPYLVAECLVRPVLVERALRNWYGVQIKNKGSEAPDFSSWWAKTATSVAPHR